MSIANLRTGAERRTPQALFRVSPATRAGEVNRMTMDLGAPESHGETASLGVLLDDCLGFTMYERRGDRAGLVSADLSVDFVRPTGWTGSHLTAEGRLETRGEDGAMASVRVFDATGELVATGTAWGNFIDGVQQSRDDRPLEPASNSVPTSTTPLKAIGGTLERTDRGARLTVPPNRSLANALGVMHGGVQACAYDLAGNAAAAGSAGAMDTSSLRINFFRTVPLDRPAVFEAEVLRAGRRVVVSRVTCTDADGRECGVATVTCRRATPGDRAPRTAAGTLGERDQAPS
ncbi:PaaI family thioesterase [Rhodococcus sp. UNC363MFTsu5.1]|uniref:PaaI family thioesterase n=1 Tax=Rhodococcus sp. UNC363MFTsu5.1 TaxID=1449069 RepID=UPI0009DEE25D|nr:PaaI family thioesterase [Rhodococcus sp. UNC363MFTsu5.1]